MNQNYKRLNDANLNQANSSMDKSVKYFQVNKQNIFKRENSLKRGVHTPNISHERYYLTKVLAYEYIP